MAAHKKNNNHKKKNSSSSRRYSPKKNIKIEFIPYKKLSQVEDKLAYILSCVEHDKIILLEGKLTFREQSELIRKTMSRIGLKFKGIEVGSFPIEPDTPFTRFKKKLLEMLGYSVGLTMIGPADIVDSIENNPEGIELTTKL